jgi:hypothetical protein
MIKIKTFYLAMLIVFSIAGCVSMDTGNITENKKNYSCKDKIVLSVTGKGAPPTKMELSEVQKYLFAERAAIIDGYRILSEKLGGVIVSSSTNTSDYIVKSDSINTITNTLLKGVKILKIKHNSNGVCEVDMKIELSKSALNKYIAESLLPDAKCIAAK